MKRNKWMRLAIKAAQKEMTTIQARNLLDYWRRIVLGV